MYQLFPEIFEETQVDHFPDDLYNNFDQSLNWVQNDPSSLIYMSDINNSTDSLPFQETFTMFPSPVLSGAYSRSGSQSSVEVFQPDLVDRSVAYSSQRVCSAPKAVKKGGAFECPFPGCSKKFTRRDNIKYHLKTHDQHRDRPFCCNLCDKSYFRAIDLTRHIKVTHDKLKAYKCTVCLQSYTRKEALKRHTEKNHFE